MSKIATITIGGMLSILLAGCGGSSVPSANAAQTVEVGCGSCIYSMEGVQGCVTAAKIGDKAYLVTGAELDAHASGLCKSAKQAKIEGKVAEGKFVASKIDLVSK